MACNARVLHVVKSLKGDGAERFVYLLLSRLREMGLDVGVLSMYPSQLSDAESKALGVPVFDIRGEHRKMHAYIPSVVRAIRQFGPSIVHTHAHVSKYWGRIAAYCAGVDHVVHTEHNPCDPRRSMRDRFFDLLLDPMTDRVVTFLADQCDELASIERIPIDRIVAIPNGLPRAATPPSNAARNEFRAELGLKPDDVMVLAVGRLEYQKCFELAVSAVPCLERSLRERCTLFIAGAGSKEAQLRALIQQLHLQSKVQLLGRRPDVMRLLEAADVLVMTSRFEGMPIVLLEAMSMGTSIVTTPWIGSRSLLHDRQLGFIADGWEPYHVASTLAAAITDVAERRRRANRARQVLETSYRLDSTARAHIALYENLVRLERAA